MRVHPWLAGFLYACAATACRKAPDANAPSYGQARAIVDRHCVSCHSAHPVIPAFPIAPGGVELDTLGQLQQYAVRVRVRTLDQTMPLLNKTQMTQAERRIVAGWVEAGAEGP